MRTSRLHIPTLREPPRDAEVASHALLVRAGFIRKLAAGIYDYLPLGVRSLRKIETIVREEMDRAGAQEVLLPAVQPAELWEESGRWKQYGPELLRFDDRKGAHFCFGPTHEEVITDLVRRDVRSYRDLPMTLYQIQVKYRDEIRPRFGLMRGREFLMKDAYSFDVDEAGAHESYDAMYQAYGRIFTRCGFDFTAVEADTGAIGGSLSHEFQVIADTGEDAIFACRECGYSANEEKAEIPTPDPIPPDAIPDKAGPGDAIEKVETPDQRTVEDVTAFLGIEPSQLLKTLLCVADGEPVAFLVRGDHELNEAKAKALLGAGLLEMADDETVTKVTGAPVGFAGPVGLGIPVYADWGLKGIDGGVTGANEGGYHYKKVYPGRDFEPAAWADLRMATSEDTCPRCGAAGAYELRRGIEVGHVFFLGTKYAKPMGATFLDEGGKEQPIEMGCYGIGVSRILAAAVEQGHDDNGIVWPLPLAPFQVAVLPLNMDDDAVRGTAEGLYEALREKGVEVILDDRKERPGAKFKDADLVGYPFQVVVGKRGLKQGALELKCRATGERDSIPLDSAAEAVWERLQAEWKKTTPADDWRFPR